MPRVHVASALLICLFWSIPCFSSTRELSISKYEEMKRRDEFAFYITGVQSGLAWAATFAATTGGKPLYCPPDEPLTEDELFEITDAGVQAMLRNPGYLSAPLDQRRHFKVSQALMLELIRRYPCND